MTLPICRCPHSGNLLPLPRLLTGHLGPFVGFASGDLFFKRICHFETVLQQVLKPVTQLLLLTGLQFQNGLFKLLDAAHDQRRIRLAKVLSNKGPLLVHLP